MEKAEKVVKAYVLTNKLKDIGRQNRHNYDKPSTEISNYIKTHKINQFTFSV